MSVTKPKVLLLLTGDIRAGVETYRKCYEMQKEVLVGCDVHTMMVTWHSSDKEFMFYERNFYRAYDMSKMELDWADSVYVIPNVDLASIRKTQNGHPPMFAHMLKALTNSGAIASLKFDYVVRCRNSLEMVFPNVESYLRGGFFVPPQLWYPDRLAVNDSYFICDRDSFFALRDADIDELVKQSWSTEILQKYILEVSKSPIGVIQAISHYNQNGRHLIKNGVFHPEVPGRVDITQAYRTPFFYS
jgi:hypothetical protein